MSNVAIGQQRLLTPHRLSHVIAIPFSVDANGTIEVCDCPANTRVLRAAIIVDAQTGTTLNAILRRQDDGGGAVNLIGSTNIATGNTYTAMTPTAALTSKAAADVKIELNLAGSAGSPSVQGAIVLELVREDYGT